MFTKKLLKLAKNPYWHINNTFFGYLWAAERTVNTTSTYSILTLYICYGKCCSEQFLIYTSSRHREKVAFVWSHVSGNPTKLIITKYDRIIVNGDINIHVNNWSDPKATKFLKILDSLGLNQHVTGPSHNCGNTLVISRGITVWYQCVWSLLCIFQSFIEYHEKSFWNHNQKKTLRYHCRTLFIL